MNAPLSRSQELIWAGQALAGDVPIYNQAWCFDLGGRLDPEAFSAAFDRLVMRCDALRTVIVGDPQSLEVRQKILTAAPSRLAVLDFSDRKNAAADADDLISARARKPFRLELATYDVALLKIADDRWKWFFNQHHIVTDAWSVALLFEKFFEELGQAAERRPALPSPVSFYEVEAAAKRSGKWVGIEEYWESIAAAASGPLPLYGGGRTEASSLAERIELSLGRDRMGQLDELARQRGVARISPAMTSFLIFATAVSAFLARVSGRRRITIGVPLLNRSSQLHKRTPGLFVEVYPLTVEIDDGDTFRTLFTKLNTAYSQNMRFAEPGCTSLTTARSFNVVLNYINAAFPEAPGLKRHVSWLSTDALETSDDMRLHIFDFNGDGVLKVAFDLNKSTFPDGLRGRIPSHFLNMVDAMLSDFDRPIYSAPFATAEERAFQLRLNDATPPSPGAGETVLSMFEKIVEERPNDIAVKHEGPPLTFAELDARAESVANVLKANGAGQGVVVGLHLRRSTDYIACLLAAMKIGAAFLPLDARLPVKRRGFILDDVNAAVILTTADLAPGLSGRAERVIDVATIGDNEASSDGGAVPSDVAYILYTSGSTGRPKGVVVEHGGLATYCAWARQVYAKDAPAAMPFFTAIGFDLTLTSVLLPLISGGEVVIYPEPENGPDLSIMDVMSDDDCDIVKLTPAHLALALPKLKDCSRISALILGGEDLKANVAQKAMDTAQSPLRIYNEYGPTEAIVGCMIHCFDPATDTGASVPIGAPADGARIYITDESGDLAPLGCVGEIEIGGDHLAKGYWNNLEASAKFREDPFVAGGRVYKTGDLARFNERGLIEYVGRRDSQVKISGVRIELGEVESALATLPQVQDAAVITRETREPSEVIDAARCVTCGLGSSHPEAQFDHAGVCSICRELETYRDRAELYFSAMPELEDILASARQRRTGKYDCVMLTSGGKDSTYALARLADLGAQILAVTLDNGFLSEGAKQNVERVTNLLGVDHRFVSTPAMNEIFVDSLKRHSNVCHGCFKTIYTLGVEVALETGTPVIVTGLSRGQFFETRLTPDLFKDRVTTKDEIDDMVLEARKAYHRTQDAVSRCLDVRFFEDDLTFEKVQFVDFYRYCDATLDEIYEYLNNRLPWKRPADTGRSSNCLINDVGIYVHKAKEGFHNYALPYSWDVRMGHKVRDAAVAELDDAIDRARVEKIMADIGYDLGADNAREKKGLAAFVVSEEPMSPSALRDGLLNYLPPEMIPSSFIHLKALPLTENGKLDRGSLAKLLDANKTSPRAAYRAPVTDAEKLLTGIWADMLRVERVGLDDNFYDLGGDSITAIKIAARASAQGLALSPTQIFHYQSIAELALYVSSHVSGEAAAANGTKPFELLGVDDESLKAIAAAMSETDPLE